MPSPDSILFCFTSSSSSSSRIIVSTTKKERQRRQQWRQLSQRSHACFRLPPATVKRDLKGGARLRFESTGADDAKGRFLGSPAIASPLPPAPACCPAHPACLPSYGGCCPPLLGSVPVLCVPCRLRQLSRLPGQPLVARAARFSSDHHPLEQCAPARARACSRAHTCVRVHAHPPPVVATCSPNRDQVIVSSDLLCLYAFASAHIVKCPSLIDKAQICEINF